MEDKNTPPSDTLREYAIRALTPRLERTLTHRAGVERGDSIEAIHQMRVWSRRSRAVLDLFGVCFAPKPFEVLAEEVKRLTRSLGQARDLDVMIQTLQGYTKELPEVQRGGVRYALEMLAQQRNTLQKPLRDAMERLEKHDIAALWEHLQLTSVKPQKGAKTLLDSRHTPQENALRVFQDRLEALVALEPCLEDPARITELHEMRIAAKRLRYTLEIFQDAFANSPEALASIQECIQAVKESQELLGEIHDADVLVPQLLAFCTQYLKAGVGKGTDGMPVAGVHFVDYEGAQGLLTLCTQIAKHRDAQFNAFIVQWRRVQKDRVFERCVHSLAQPITSKQTTVPKETSSLEDKSEPQKSSQPVARPRRRSPETSD